MACSSSVFDSAELEPRATDIEEQQKIDSFMEKYCGCTNGPKKSPCSKFFPREVVASSRDNCAQLRTRELDLVIMGQLSALCTSKDCIPPMYKGAAESFQPHTSFLFIEESKSAEACSFSSMEFS